MLKRVIDIFFSLFFILSLSIPMLIIALVISLGRKGGVLFKQQRVGKMGVPFQILKFRTMRSGSEAEGLISIGKRDPRVTGIGQFLRRSKLDELPQLFNILKGEMSFIGPRPEVPRFVKMYTEEQMKVLGMRPGLSDPASLAFFNESELLGASDDPEKHYIEVIMPAKLKMNLDYVLNHSIGKDFSLAMKTIKKILSL